MTLLKGRSAMFNPIGGETISRYLATLFLALLFIAPMTQANATSKATRYLIKQEIANGCDTKRGKFNATGIIERDLTGDGAKDLILDHGGITCSDGSRSGFCGAAMCSVIFYVRDNNGLLQQKLEVLSIGATNKGGNPANIELINHRGKTSIVRWNGSTFD